MFKKKKSDHFCENNPAKYYSFYASSQKKQIMACIIISAIYTCKLANENYLAVIDAFFYL